MNLQLPKNKKKWLIVGGGVALTALSVGFIASTAQYCSSAKTVRKQETEIVLLKLKINDLEQQNKQLIKEKEELTAELNSLKQRLETLQAQYDRSRNAWKSTTANYLSKISDLNKKLNSDDNRFEPSINPEENEKPELSFEEEIELFKNNVISSKEQYSIRLNELKQQLSVLRIETNSETTQNYVDEFLKELNAKQALIENMPVNSLEDITELVNRINSSESVINKQYFNLVAELTNEIANKKDTIAEKEKQLASAFENAKGLIKQILEASENQIEYLLNLRDKVSVYLNKDYSQYASEEFANNIKSSANNLISDINNYKIELTVAIEQAKLDYEKALESKRVEDFTSINIKSFGIKNKIFLDEFDSLANKDFEQAFAKYTKQLAEYAKKSQEYNDLQIENNKNLAKIEELNRELSLAEEKINNFDSTITDLNQKLKDKLIDSLIQVNSVLETVITSLENDSADNSELVNPLKEQYDVILNTILESTDPEFVEKYSDIANSALALISDLIFNYQQSRVLPLEGEIVKLNTEIERLNSTIETMKTNIATKESLISQYQEQIAELETEKETLTTNLASANEELENTKTELEDLKFSNQTFLISQKDELAKVNNKLDLLKTKAKEILAISEESSAKEELSALVDSETSTNVEESIDKITEEIKNNSELSLNIINKLNEVLKVNYDKKIADKVAELEELGTQKDQIEASKSSLENELSVKTAENQATSEELKDLVSKQNDLITEQGNKFDQLISKYKELREQATELLSNSENSSQKTELENKLSQSVESEKSKELSTLVSQNNNISDYNIGLVELIKELTKVNYEKQIKDKNAYEVLLKNQLTETQASKDKLDEEVKKLEAENSELKKNQGTKVQELETKLATANEETRKQSTLVAEKEKEIQRLSRLNSSYSSQISTLQSQIRTLESDKNSLQSQLASMTTSRNYWEMRYKDLIGRPDKIEQDDSVISSPVESDSTNKLITTPYNMTLSQEVQLVVKDLLQGEAGFNNYIILTKNQKDKEIQEKILKNFGFHFGTNSIYKFEEISYTQAKKLTKNLSTITLTKDSKINTNKFDDFKQMFKSEMFCLDLGYVSGTFNSTSIYKSDKQFTNSEWQFQPGLNYDSGDKQDYRFNPKTNYIYYQINEQQNYRINQQLLIITDSPSQKSYIGMCYTFTSKNSSYNKTITLRSLGTKYDSDKLTHGEYKQGQDLKPTNFKFYPEEKRIRDLYSQINDLPLTRIEYRINTPNMRLNSNSIVLSHISINEKR
ncbi:hypothetical protein FRW55_01935 [Mycoplasma anserisalpingitidis]|uniref:Uncharacterized protein n=1 Tax=Mycoplasma anserisalpingitidis TaxID=519450 RepID=A0A5B8K7P1_9MOLU|nr:hypothetical protein [Mycoplasma anserisalpingitidis]QDY86917.1 hypothetical protein FRW55_01935 [Mycoplasma anserisalpingitidis]